MGSKTILTLVFVTAILVQKAEVNFEVGAAQQPELAPQGLNCFLRFWRAMGARRQSLLSPLKNLPNSLAPSPSVIVPPSRDKKTRLTDFGKRMMNGVREIGFSSSKPIQSPPKYPVHDPALVALGVHPPAGPTLIDWRIPYITYPKVHDQHQYYICECAWAFSTVSALEILYSRIHNKRTHFSYQQMIDCCPYTYGCNGGSVESALSYMVEVGVTLSNFYHPFISAKRECSDFQLAKKVTKYRRIRNRETAIVNALDKSPLIVNLHCPEEIKSYKSGVADPAYCPNDSDSLTHTVLIVGHGADYWIIRNTWGEEHGQKVRALNTEITLRKIN